MSEPEGITAVGISRGDNVEITGVAGNSDTLFVGLRGYVSGSSEDGTLHKVVLDEGGYVFAPSTSLKKLEEPEW